MRSPLPVGFLGALSVAAVLLRWGAAFAQTLTAEELVARHIEARGGHGKLKAINTLKITRTFMTLGGEYNVVIYKKRPALYRSEVTPSSGPATFRGVNDVEAWDVSAKGEVTARPADWFSETRELDADFDGLLVDYQAKGHTVVYAGTEAVGGRPAHKLTVTLASGAIRNVYLDAATFLERRHTGRMTIPPGRKVAVELDFSDYREVAGVKFPFAIDENRDAMGQTYAIYTRHIEANVPVDDTVFRRPR